jgi:hypothetical protein
MEQAPPTTEEQFRAPEVIARSRLKRLGRLALRSKKGAPQYSDEPVPGYVEAPMRYMWRQNRQDLKRIEKIKNYVDSNEHNLARANYRADMQAESHAAGSALELESIKKTLSASSKKTIEGFMTGRRNNKSIYSFTNTIPGAYSRDEKIITKKSAGINLEKNMDRSEGYKTFAMNALTNASTFARTELHRDEESRVLPLLGKGVQEMLIGEYKDEGRNNSEINKAMQEYEGGISTLLWKMDFIEPYDKGTDLIRGQRARFNPAITWADKPSGVPDENILTASLAYDDNNEFHRLAAKSLGSNGEGMVFQLAMSAGTGEEYTNLPFIEMRLTPAPEELSMDNIMDTINRSQPAVS